MKNKKVNFLTLLLTLMLILGLTACGSQATESDQATNGSSDANTSGVQDSLVDEKILILSDGGITLNGETVGIEEDSPVYVSNDIIYYEDRDTYESGHAYGEAVDNEKHSAADAFAHTVVNIAEAGTYRIQGSLSKGQIRVDLGEEAKENPGATATLILDGVDLRCEVAPAILFLNVYECDYGWSAESAGSVVDTAAAGANLVIADDSVNQITGSHVAKIYKDGGEEKKLWKQDGAVYSYMSMNVDGEKTGTGKLDITADNEGLDTELHLTINGGNLSIRAQNDGINTNEDGVSVTTINGGDIHIIAGLGEEGDGIDSNGWLVINGGTVVASANPAADAGLDSDMGSYINGGTVVALGSTMDWAESDSDQVTMNLQFASYQASDSAIVIIDQEGKYVFAYDPSEDEVLGENIRRYMGAIISSPRFAVGDSYKVFIGGTVDGTEVAGVYDAEGIGGYEGGVQQVYTGTDVMRRPMGGFNGDRDFDKERPEGGRPEGEFPEGKFPEGEFPEGMKPGNMRPEGRPELPDGQMPELPDGQMPQMPEGETFVGAGNEIFYMQDKVNFFSGVAGNDNTV